MLLPPGTSHFTERDLGLSLACCCYAQAFIPSGTQCLLMLCYSQSKSGIVILGKGFHMAVSAQKRGGGGTFFLQPPKDIEDRIGDI